MRPDASRPGDEPPLGRVERLAVNFQQKQLAFSRFPVAHAGSVRGREKQLADISNCDLRT